MLVTFNAAPSGGLPVTLYQIVITPQVGATRYCNGTHSPILCTGLINGVGATAVVYGVNSKGSGLTSSSSTPIIPGCFCNGHSTTCDVNGVCTNCQGHTTGSLCDRCMTGFVGDPEIQDCGVPGQGPNGSAASLQFGLASVLAVLCSAAWQLLA